MKSETDSIWAVVPAAGAGRRMSTNIPKQYLPLGEKTVLEHTLDTLLACRQLAGVVVVLSAGDDYWPDLQERYSSQQLEVVTGGAERCHSVLNGLTHLAGRANADDWVLVHDAARPCVRLTDIDTLIKTLSATSHGGLLGVPVADTIKQVDGGDRVTATVAREDLWHAYTPQMFRIGMLRAALQYTINNDLFVTDEASAMEFAGYQPQMVPGQRDNIKITVSSDLELAAFYLQTRKQP
ncbi:MAG: 2-C-methyl-D-erythritol 4-phosphate cytidylyltransferase [Gammaproteobacteria bacterium]|nr:2-C-methyl-D-erythritol 4-phosphate cytidylyltransferase [Gammaproteobacteria bacterium]